MEYDGFLMEIVDFVESCARCPGKHCQCVHGLFAHMRFISEKFSDIVGSSLSCKMLTVVTKLYICEKAIFQNHEKNEDVMRERPDFSINVFITRIYENIQEPREYDSTHIVESIECLLVLEDEKNFHNLGVYVANMNISWRLIRHLAIALSKVSSCQSHHMSFQKIMCHMACNVTKFFSSMKHSGISTSKNDMLLVQFFYSILVHFLSDTEVCSVVVLFLDGPDRMLDLVFRIKEYFIDNVHHLDPGVKTDNDVLALFSKLFGLADSIIAICSETVPDKQILQWYVMSPLTKTRIVAMETLYRIISGDLCCKRFNAFVGTANAGIRHHNTLSNVFLDLKVFSFENWNEVWTGILVNALSAMIVLNLEGGVNAVFCSMRDLHNKVFDKEFSKTSCQTLDYLMILMDSLITVVGILSKFEEVSLFRILEAYSSVAGSGDVLRNPSLFSIHFSALKTMVLLVKSQKTSLRLSSSLENILKKHRDQTTSSMKSAVLVLAIIDTMPHSEMGKNIRTDVPNIKQILFDLNVSKETHAPTAVFLAARLFLHTIQGKRSERYSQDAISDIVKNMKMAGDTENPLFANEVACVFAEIAIFTDSSSLAGRVLSLLLEWANNRTYGTISDIVLLKYFESLPVILTKKGHDTYAAKGRQEEIQKTHNHKGTVEAMYKYLSRRFLENTDNEYKHLYFIHSFYRFVKMFTDEKVIGRIFSMKESERVKEEIKNFIASSSKFQSSSQTMGNGLRLVAYSIRMCDRYKHVSLREFLEFVQTHTLDENDTDVKYQGFERISEEIKIVLDFKKSIQNDPKAVERLLRLFRS